MLDLNYVIGADGQKTLSATGSTIQSATITTSGFPVQITITGDAEPAGAGWHRLQIYRDSRVQLSKTIPQSSHKISPRPLKIDVRRFA